jgi:hypothetical protein
MHGWIAFPKDAEATVVVQSREGTLEHPTSSPEPRAVLGSAVSDAQFDAAVP